MAKGNEYSEEQVTQQLVEELKFYFEEVGTMTDSGYRVENPELLRERAESGDQSALVVYNVYLDNVDKEPSQVATRNAFTDYAGCVIENAFGLYIAVIRGDLAEALIGAIQKGLWTQAVTLVAQIAGLSVKSLNIAATAAQIAAAAIVCGLK